MTCADQLKAARLLNAFIATLRARPEDRDEVLERHVAYVGGPGMSAIDLAKLKLLAQAALPGGAGFTALVIFREVANPAAVLALMARLEAAEEHAKTQHDRVEFILKDNERFQALATEHAEARRNAEASEAALIERVEEAERRADLRQKLLDAEKAERDALRERLQGAQEEAYGALDAARAANEEAGRRSAEIESLKKRAELAESRKEHTEYWYGVRLERLKDMAKERGFWREMAAIIANGTVGDEPPTYAQQLNLAIGRAEDAKKKNAALLTRVSQFEALARAALLAFQYIDDRSAGSSDAWNALASALGMDPGESDVSEMVTALQALAVTSEGR
ncbi:hypothetical protein [Myxococcus xanthus]|uniref:hypothetical protein n=1 Tax=Myxococcus xanthus TaxID=34 RepID=UPI00112BE520|nr:hypothetical protein [Myxococcus xanthus]QDE83286.1 hypothetical protein BHS07_17950 [Myxococcus xanthus]